MNITTDNSEWLVVTVLAGVDLEDKNSSGRGQRNYSAGTQLVSAAHKEAGAASHPGVPGIPCAILFCAVGLWWE